jgi:hypothetical protein
MENTYYYEVEVQHFDEYDGIKGRKTHLVKAKGIIGAIKLTKKKLGKEGYVVLRAEKTDYDTIFI